MEKVQLYALDITGLDPDQPDWGRWVEPSRVAAAARYRFREDRARCIGGGLLLAYAALRHDPCPEIPFRTATGPYGKPYAPGRPDFHFSLSHSGRWVVCAVAGQPVGIDIEHIDSYHPGVPQRVFSEAEQADLYALPSAQQKAAFYVFWTLKESYIKATGRGLGEALRQYTMTRGDPITLSRHGTSVPVQLAILPSPDPDYQLAIAQLPSFSERGF